MSLCPGWSRLCRADTASGRWCFKYTAEQVPARVLAQYSVVDLKVAFLTLNLFSLLNLADVLKSVLQQLDSETFSRDALIQEQNVKLAEGENIIHSSQVAIERLEKRTKVQEQQVKNKTCATHLWLQVFRCAYQLLFFVHVHVIVADWHSAENDWNLRGGKTFSAAGAGSQRAAAAEGACWQEMHGAAAGQCGQRHTTQVGERMCELLPTQQD